MAISLVDYSLFTTSVNTMAITASVPATITAGDYLLFSINIRGGGGTATTPTGFTNFVNIVRSTNGRHYVFGKVADGSETSVASTANLNGNHCAILLVLRGVHTTTPVNITGTAGGASSAVHTAPSVTTTVDKCFVVHFAATALVGSFNYSCSPGIAIAQAKSTVSGVDNVLGSAYLLQPTAGATLADQATMSNGEAGYWVASTIALAPAPESVLTGISILQGVNTLQF